MIFFDFFSIEKPSLEPFGSLWVHPVGLIAKKPGYARRLKFVFHYKFKNITNNIVIYWMIF